jgi:hypothetical protein
MTSIIRRMFGMTRKKTRASEFDTYEVARAINMNPRARGVISTCLYIANDSNDINDAFISRYIDPLFSSIAAARQMLPDWAYRVYLDPRLAPLVLDSLVEAGAEVCIMNAPSRGHVGSKWRYLPAADHLPFLAVDSDDDIFIKYGKCGGALVKHLHSWLKSDDEFFQMHVYLYSLFIPIMGKYWGGKPNCIPNIHDLINMYTDDWYGCDESMLTREIYPLFKRRGVHIMRNAHEIAAVTLGLVTLVICLYVLFRSSTKPREG